MELKLGDFGNASQSGQVGAMRYTWTGPELFFAPEQVKNEGYSDEIDSWNVGLLIYNMLFGELPFIWPQNTKIKFLLNKIKHKEV